MGTENTLFGNQDVDLTAITPEEALAMLVGENGKYATPAELAKAALHSQKHIATLERENASYKETALKAKGVDDILAALATSTAKPTPTENTTDHGATRGSEEDVASIVAKMFAERESKEAERIQAANRQQVLDELVKLYGTKAADVYESAGKSLGINLDELAAKSPKAVMKLVADARPAMQQDSSFTTSTHTTPASKFAGGNLTKAEIDKMYSEGKIKLYEKHELENKMIGILGPDKFFNRG